MRLAGACLFSILPLSSDSSLSLDLSPSRTHTSHTSSEVVIIKASPPSCSSLFSPLFLFISLVCCLLKFSCKFSLIAYLYSFNKKSSNATTSYLFLITYSFLPDISRFYFIWPPSFISASSSSLRDWSRLGSPLEEDLEPLFLAVYVFHILWNRSTYIRERGNGLIGVRGRIAFMTDIEVRLVAWAADRLLLSTRFFNLM